MTIKNKFKKMFEEEFEDPNESFMFFLLSLISNERLKEIINKGTKCYYNNLKKY